MSEVEQKLISGNEEKAVAASSYSKVELSSYAARLINCSPARGRENQIIIGPEQRECSIINPSERKRAGYN
jgi:hypothetical protein